MARTGVPLEIRVETFAVHDGRNEVRFPMATGFSQSTDSGKLFVLLMFEAFERRHRADVA
jgi:hypothetical protein